MAVEFCEKTELTTLAFGVLRGTVSYSFHFFGRELNLVCELLPDGEGRMPATFRVYGLNVLQKEVVVMISKITEGAVQKLRCLHVGGLGNSRLEGEWVVGMISEVQLFLIFEEMTGATQVLGVEKQEIWIMPRLTVVGIHVC